MFIAQSLVFKFARIDFLLLPDQCQSHLCWFKLILDISFLCGLYDLLVMIFLVGAVLLHQSIVLGLSCPNLWLKVFSLFSYFIQLSLQSFFLLLDFGEDRLQFLEFEMCVNINIFNLVFVVVLELYILLFHALLLLNEKLLRFLICCTNIFLLANYHSFVFLNFVVIDKLFILETGKKSRDVAPFFRDRFYNFLVSSCFLFLEEFVGLWATKLGKTVIRIDIRLLFA